MDLPTMEEIHAELLVIHKRREQAIDLLIRCLIEIDTTTTRADVLLDRALVLTGHA